jgi:hypothetical protein
MRLPALIALGLMAALTAGSPALAAPAGPRTPAVQTRDLVGEAALAAARAHIAFAVGDYAAGKKGLAEVRRLLKAAAAASPPEQTRDVLEALKELGEVEALAARWDKKAARMSRRLAEGLFDGFDGLAGVKTFPH